MCINRRNTSLSSGNLEATIHIHTNLSEFSVPIYLYNGLLTVRPLISKSIERACLPF